MNCKQIQELLPLYVGRDLEEKRARLIATHLQSCTECAGSAAEYEETHRLLQGFAPPTFSEATFDGIRQRVWREIERGEATAQSLPQLVAGLFRPRLSWAVASVVLVAVFLFAFYFIANRGSERREVAEVQPTRSPQKPAAAVSGSPAKVLDPKKDVKASISGAGDRPRQSPQRKRLSTAANRAPVLASNRPAQPSTGGQPSSESTNLAEPGVSGEPAVSGQILRVEMQTKDPNIRIIWFSPQHTKQDSPGKFPKVSRRHANA
jgi:anti-sigma factor RsiW